MRGSFADEFLELPEEITVTAMRTHQKFLPVRGPGGLLPHFLAVMDNDDDRKGFIAKGCEWVLNARLADARFFFDEDAKKSLETRLPELERLTFQDKLGSYRQKTARIQELVEVIAARSAARIWSRMSGPPRCSRRRTSSATSSRSSRTCRASWEGSTPGASAIPIPSGRPSTTSTARPRPPTIRRATPPARFSRWPTVSTRSRASSASA